jgi:hypothetical protein
VIDDDDGDMAEMEILAASNGEGVTTATAMSGDNVHGITEMEYQKWQNRNERIEMKE